MSNWQISSHMDCIIRAQLSHMKKYTKCKFGNGFWEVYKSNFMEVVRNMFSELKK